LVEEPWYHYRLRDGSITTSKTLYNYECYIKVAQLQMVAANNETLEHRRLFLLRSCSENLKLAQFGTDYFSKPLFSIPESRKFLGMKDLM
jgi:hypothetical protein